MPQESDNAFTHHFREQKRLYGSPQVAINLIDGKKAEGVLEEKFRKLFANSQMTGLIYEFFDFHRECSKMRYERLSLLTDRLAKHDFGYCKVEMGGGGAVGTQQGGGGVAIT